MFQPHILRYGIIIPTMIGRAGTDGKSIPALNSISENGIRFLPDAKYSLMKRTIIGTNTQQDLQFLFHGNSLTSTSV